LGHAGVIRYLIGDYIIGHLVGHETIIKPDRSWRWPLYGRAHLYEPVIKYK
jgi:hypothetical protein